MKYVHNVQFVGVNSRTNVGGVDIYIKENLNFIRRQHLEFSTDALETCFVVLREKDKRVFLLV